MYTEGIIEEPCGKRVMLIPNIWIGPKTWCQWPGLTGPQHAPCLEYAKSQIKESDNSLN